MKYAILLLLISGYSWSLLQYLVAEPFDATVLLTMTGLANYYFVNDKQK